MEELNVMERNMKRKIELLAPAGSWEAFVAAVENGTDAVYLGGRLFNARQFASNFDGEQLKKALDYAHVRGVNIYLALNTLVLDDEIKDAMAFAEEAYLAGIDGVIVQDLGLAGLLRQSLPDLGLHASTQMTVYNLEGVRTLEKLGFSRVVPARELSLEEIRHIAENTSLEIEVFVHGALCVSYSGQCLMSSIIGGRSGNRGKCAQPCRLPYELVRESQDSRKRRETITAGYLLSPKDLCSVNQLRQIKEAGVKALKIEGRMKSPEYVATVVRIYRKYLDSMPDDRNNPGKKGIDAKDLRDLSQVFNRGGFSEGYLNGKTGRDMMCFEKPKNWGIYLGETMSYDRTSNSVRIKLEEDLALGDGVEVWNGENDSPGALVSEIRLNGKRVDTALKNSIVDIGSIKGRVAKGNKVYKTSDRMLNEIAKETYSGKNFKKIFINGKITLKSELPVTLRVSDEAGNEITSSGGYIPEKAVKRPLTVERVLEQLNKTGSTPFHFKDIDIELDEDISVPVSEINNIRRNALDELEQKRAVKYSRNISDDCLERTEKMLHFPGNSRNMIKDVKISVLFYSIKDSCDFRDLEADRIYIPFDALLNKKVPTLLSTCREKGCEVYVRFPSITRGNYDGLIKANIRLLEEFGIEGVLAGSLGLLEHLKSLQSLRIMGDYPLNVLNSFAMEELAELKLEGAVLSPELNLKQINRLGKKPGFMTEAIVYGRLPLMTSEYCPAGSTEGNFSSCSKCSMPCGKGNYRLKDRMGMEFPLLCDKIDCRSTIFNSNVLLTLESLDQIRDSGVDRVRIDITDEGFDETAEIVNMHREAVKNGYARAAGKYGSLIERIKSRGFTKGHYFRGV